VREVPQCVFDRAIAQEPIFTADEVADWPEGLLEGLVQQGIIKPTNNAQAVTCDACGRDHVEPVTYLPGAPGEEIRAFIPCPDVGRVRVDLKRLRQWAVDTSKLNSVLATPPAAGTKDGPTFVFKRNAERWLIRFRNEEGSFTPIDGIIYIAQLLGNPGRSFSAGEMKASVADPWSSDTSRVLSYGSQEILDSQASVTQGTRQAAIDKKAIQQCEARLTQILVERDDAREAGEIDKLGELEEEEKRINDYLTKARNIRGGSRPLSDSKRSMFNSVKQAIDRAMKKLASADPPLPQLHEHLSKALDSGNGVFMYRPNLPAPSWEL
jgi:hypothetical protein